MKRREQVGPLLVAALFGAAATTACLQPAMLPPTTVGGTPGSALPQMPEIPRGFDPPATLHVDEPSGARPELTVVAAVSSEGDLPPERALEAYQRASTVIEQADPACGLSWPLLAAIGSIESDHGRVGGRVLSADGVAHPPILGPRLDGAGPVARLVDTDQGGLDGDTAFDRALGPFQLIPSTWAVVAVDGDSDGTRDPQDIDDASLAAAVYLCAWHDDLSTDAGRRAAVHRYNHAWSYVDHVLQVMQLYASAAAVTMTSHIISVMEPAPAGEAAPATQPVGFGSVVGDGAWSSALGSVWASPPHVNWVSTPHPTLPASTPWPSSTPWAEPSPVTTTEPTGDPTTQPTGGPTVPPNTVLPTTVPPSPDLSSTDPPTATPASAGPTPRPTSSPTPTPSPSTSPTSPVRTPGPEASDTPSSAPPDETGSSAATGGTTHGGDPGMEMSAPEAEAWTSCLDTWGRSAGDDELGQCLQEALGLPPDDPRLVWLVVNLLAWRND